jgi:3-hydroxymyristoyl/3-hydroxydecanoyl-(acyl carrier protein) dehydratase
MGISVVKNPSIKTIYMIHHSSNVTRETGFIDGHFCGEKSIDENNNMIHHSSNVTREIGFIDGHFCDEKPIVESNKYDFEHQYSRKYT